MAACLRHKVLVASQAACVTALPRPPPQAEEDQLLARQPLPLDRLNQVQGWIIEHRALIHQQRLANQAHDAALVQREAQLRAAETEWEFVGHMQADIDEVRAQERAIRSEVASTMHQLETKAATKYIKRMEKAQAELEDFQREQEAIRAAQVRCGEGRWFCVKRGWVRSPLGVSGLLSRAYVECVLPDLVVITASAVFLLEFGCLSVPCMVRMSFNCATALACPSANAPPSCTPPPRRAAKIGQKLAQQRVLRAQNEAEMDKLFGAVAVDAELTRRHLAHLELKVGGDGGLRLKQIAFA